VLRPFPAHRQQKRQQAPGKAAKTRAAAAPLDFDKPFASPLYFIFSMIQYSPINLYKQTSRLKLFVSDGLFMPIFTGRK
jgi:hypothetical protein